MKWPVATIGEVCEVVSGATPKTDKPEFWDGDVPWVTPKDLSQLGQKYLSDTHRHITKAGLKSCSARMLPARSVLLSSRAPIGLVAINALPVCTNQGFKSLVPRFDLVSPDFLFWWLKAHEEQIRSKGRGATFKEVSKKIVEDLRIPLPPLDEQNRIAGILDKADALRAKRRAALAQLDTLARSIFFDMFGDPDTNPNEMCKLPLGDLVRLKSGEFLPATEMVDSGPYSVLGGNGINGFHDRYMFQDRQIVIGRVGVYCGCVHASPPKSWVTDNALYVSERSPRLRFEYLLHALTHARLNQYASQSGQPLVSGSRIYPVTILVPPEELQIAFEVRIASTGKLKHLYDAAISKVDVLIATLQHRAFQGEL